MIFINYYCVHVNYYISLLNYLLFENNNNFQSISRDVQRFQYTRNDRITMVMPMRMRKLPC